MRAYYERPNFYSAAVYISQSTGSLMFLINLGLIITATFGYGLQRLFYGPLRPIETEQLYDKAWFAVSETLLAMTIFRDDIGIWFFAMFLCLLAGKLWQWIGEGRVEFLEQQPPANPKLFHTRLMSSLLLSVAFDVFMMNYCIDSILSDARAGVMVMFGFEYVLLAIASVSTLMRYTLSLVELYITHRQEKARDEARRVAREHARQQAETAERSAEPALDDDDDDEVPGWEEKGRWVFYLDLTTDFIKSVVYLGFFMILMMFFGIPIHIMRDLFMTIRSFCKRVNDFIQYRNATRDMNTRYPDATAQDLERDNTCIVCREEMRPWVAPGAEGAQHRRRMDERQRPKKLPCGHILHFSCLRSWLERQQVCPTCRRPVLSQPTPPNNHQNPGQPNVQPNQLRGMLGGMLPQGFAGGQAPAPGQPPQQGLQAGQPNRPAGNMRVFNFGPIRIALGNLRIPQNQPGNANPDNNNMIANLAQQLAQNQNQNQNQNPNVQQNQAPPQPQLYPFALAGAAPDHPTNIMAQVLRTQRDVIESVRQLNLHHQQLQNIQSILNNMNQVHQNWVAPAPHARLYNQPNPHPPQAYVNPAFQQPAPINPQAYFANGPVLRQGDTGLPHGVVLPEGWTLRPMALTSQPGTPAPAPAPGSAPTSQSPIGTPSPGLAQVPTQPQSEIPVVHPSSSSLGPQEPTPSSSAEFSTEPPPSSSSSGTQIPPTSSAEGPSSSAKQAEPSSLESSWSFGNTNTPASNEAEGSSSAAGVASGVDGHGHGQNASKRTVTVEDVDEEGY
jgi:E3 ubiquitin-protein ligase synoviolin